MQTDDCRKIADRFGCEVSDLLIKTAGFTAVPVSDDEVEKGAAPSGAMKISGLGAVYGNIDRDNDIFASGAFSESIIALKASHKQGRLGMFWNHNYHSALPIGVWNSIEETGEGIYVKGFIDPEGGGRPDLASQSFGAQVIRQIKNGGITDLSVTGKILEREHRDDGVRLITKAEIREVSVVWFGANGRAAIDTTSGKKMTAIDLLKILAKPVD